MSERALRHIQHLAADIGPRGSCTAEERRAAEYCRQVLRDLGYEAHLREFRAPRSGWAPFSIGSALVLLALLLFWVLTRPVEGVVPEGGLHAAGRIVAAVVAAGVTASIFMQLLFRPNLLSRLVPSGTSQNVHAVAVPRGDVRRTLVVVGHVDTHRTPWAMASPLAFRLFQILTTLGVVSFVVLAALMIAGVIWPGLPLMPLALGPAAVVALVAVVSVQPEFSRFVHGANDNASGAAAVLALAERLKAEPLEHTAVWLLNSGAEEVGATGPVRLLEEHPELKDAAWLVLDSIAGPGAGPCLITAEHLLVPLRADAGLLALARVVAEARPGLGVYEHYYRGLFSEHSPLAAAGCRSLAIINFSPRGVLPNWHRPTDTFENIDAGVLDRTEELVWEFLRRFDRQGKA